MLVMLVMMADGWRMLYDGRCMIMMMLNMMMMVMMDIVSITINVCICFDGCYYDENEHSTIRACVIDGMLQFVIKTCFPPEGGRSGIRSRGGIRSQGCQRGCKHYRIGGPKPLS